tara:strand:- start:3554 stop:4594 length:1041 start_codon:yes stop_codon:yes gene_type:complete
LAASGGHWNNLAEAQELSQAKRVAGIIEEDVKRGGLMGLLPVMQQTGTQLEWVREGTVGTSSRASIGSQLAWSEETTYDTINESLVIRYKQTALNKYVEGVYGTFNNYAAIQAMEDRKAIVQGANDDLIYGDPTNGAAGSSEARGVHYLSQLYPTALGGSTNAMNIDEGEAGLALANMRQLEREMKYGIDFWLFPYPILDRLSAYVQEAGLSTNTFGNIDFTLDDLGRRVTSWNGAPIIGSDYLVAEQANTGADGTSLRAKHSSGDQQYSVFAIKRGQVARGEGGLTFAFGGDGASPGEPLMVDYFPSLEDFDASGLRHRMYYNLADGSRMSVGRIYDIEDSAVVA